MENRGYNTDDRTVDRVNGIEPLAGKETYVTHNVKQGPTYGVFWPEGKPFGSSSNPPPTEVNIDDPVRRAMSENNANENQRYGISSSNSPRRSSSSGNKRSSSKKKSSTSASQKRRESKKALPDYDDVELPSRGDSRRKLASRNGSQDSSACCYCRMSARCIVAIIVVVMLLAAAGIIAGVIAGTHNQPTCTEFTKYKDKFVFGSDLREDLSTSEECAEACLLSPVCGGYDFDRLREKCFLVNGAVGLALLQNATTTDHFERQTVCDKTETTQIVCHMSHTINGNAAGGHDAGFTNLEECNRMCLLEDGCLGIDYHKTSGQCWVHTLTDNAISNDCCKHYSKVCQRCTYTEERNKFTKAAVPVNALINEISQCGDLCNAKPDCGGFDFEYTPKTCSLAYVNDFLTLDLDNAVNFKKGACYDIKAPT